MFLGKQQIIEISQQRGQRRGNYYMLNFLRDRREGYNVVYLDETWINKNHCRAAAWYPSFDLLKELLKDRAVDFDPIPNIPAGKGKRRTILYAGSASTGFIPRVEKVRCL